MLLYNSAVSGNCYKVRLLASHLGYRLVRRDPDTGELHDSSPESAATNAETIGKVGPLASHLAIPLELHELDVVDRSNRPEVIGRLNPALRVPTLVLDDGRPLAESNAIIDYLAADTEYLPGDPYELAQALAWQFFEQYEIEPNLAVARFLKLFGVEAPEAFWRARFDAGRKGLEALERGLTANTWLVGERYSVADISLYAYTHVAHEGDFDLEPYPEIRAWLQRVAAQPGHITIGA
jgi:glutathione S-transferase